MPSPFHAGERAVQERLGETDGADANGRVISDRILPGARPFIAAQSVVVVASADATGAPWASLWCGRPGFVRAGEHHLDIDLDALVHDHGDPVWQHLEEDPRLGLLFIELGSRRRYRINGRVSRAGTRLRLDVAEAFPNCPRFLHRRIPHLGEPRAAVDRWGPPTAADRATLATADTWFVATSNPEGHLDASHRGGRPGFVELLADGHLRIPDYPGNHLYNTLGNLVRDPRVALIVPDFAANTVHQISGVADIAWAEPDPAGRSAGTGRFWTVRPERHRWAELPLGIAWETLEASPFSPAWG